MSGSPLRARNVVVVLIVFAVSVLYNAYLHPAGVPGSEIWYILWFVLIGAVILGVGWVGWQWATTVRTLDRKQRTTTTMMLGGLLLALTSALSQRADCSYFCTEPRPWRYPEFSIRSHAGPLGFEMPMLELGAATDCFCPELLALPNLLSGLLLIVGGSLLQSHFADRPTIVSG